MQTANKLRRMCNAPGLLAGCVGVLVQRARSRKLGLREFPAERLRRARRRFLVSAKRPMMLVTAIVS